MTSMAQCLGTLCCVWLAACGTSHSYESSLDVYYPSVLLRVSPPVSLPAEAYNSCPSLCCLTFSLLTSVPVFLCLLRRRPHCLIVGHRLPYCVVASWGWALLLCRSWHWGILTPSWLLTSERQPPNKVNIWSLFIAILLVMQSNRCLAALHTAHPVALH